MSKKSNIKMNRSFWCVMLPILLFAFSGSWVSGCGTGADDGECPDTSFSQTNLDTLEAKNPKFIWRICNTNKKYAMENVEILNKWSYEVLSPCTCTEYNIGVNDGEIPIYWVKYEQNKDEYSFIYLDSYSANRGLADSTAILRTPGRYTYYFLRDTSIQTTKWVEIEREAYY